MIFSLIPLRWWIYLGAVASVAAAIWLWGTMRYKDGVSDTVRKYEAAATVQREINAKASFRAIENTAVAVETFTKIETVETIRYVKDQTAVADVWRYADRLRDELARRSATPVEATSACAAQDRRLRGAEGLIGEYVEALATCAGVAVEGRHLAEKLSNQNRLWKEYVEALP